MDGTRQPGESGSLGDRAPSSLPDGWGNLGKTRGVGAGVVNVFIPLFYDLPLSIYIGHFRD